MNNPDFHKERSSLQLLGKGFIIVVVVVFSAVSFTLGYYVGKYGNLSHTAEMVPIPQGQEAAELLQPQPADIAENKGTPRAEAKAGGPDPALQKEPVVIDKAQKPGPLKAGTPVKENPASQNVAQLVTQQLPKEPVTDSVKKPGAKAGSASEGSGKTEGTLYTVQMAAFKSASEAKSFSSKHSKKGLKTYITTTTDKNKVTIYKVKTGEFRDRKAAEIMSLKLNKTEKLKTFVTLKSQ